MPTHHPTEIKHPQQPKYKNIDDFEQAIQAQEVSFACGTLQQWEIDDVNEAHAAVLAEFTNLHKRIADLCLSLEDMFLLIQEYGSPTMKAHATRIINAHITLKENQLPESWGIE